MPLSYRSGEMDSVSRVCVTVHDETGVRRQAIGQECVDGLLVECYLSQDARNVVAAGEQIDHDGLDAAGAGCQMLGRAPGVDDEAEPAPITPRRHGVADSSLTDVASPFSRASPRQASDLSLLMAHTRE